MNVNLSDWLPVTNVMSCDSFTQLFSNWFVCRCICYPIMWTLGILGQRKLDKLYTVSSFSWVSRIKCESISRLALFPVTISLSGWCFISSFLFFLFLFFASFHPWKWDPLLHVLVQSLRWQKQIHVWIWGIFLFHLILDLLLLFIMTWEWNSFLLLFSVCYLWHKTGTVRVRCGYCCWLYSLLWVLYIHRIPSRFSIHFLSLQVSHVYSTSSPSEPLCSPDHSLNPTGHHLTSCCHGTVLPLQIRRLRKRLALFICPWSFMLLKVYGFLLLDLMQFLYSNENVDRFPTSSTLYKEFY